MGLRERRRAKRLKRQAKATLRNNTPISPEVATYYANLRRRLLSEDDGSIATMGSVIRRRRAIDAAAIQIEQTPSAPVPNDETVIIGALVRISEEMPPMHVECEVDSAWFQAATALPEISIGYPANRKGSSIMGWCSGTDVFDEMAGAILSSTLSEGQKVDLLRHLIETLENEDWDCQQDSRYYGSQPLVRQAFRQVHPDWDDLSDVIDPVEAFILELPDSIRSAMRILATYGQEDGGHHKAWVIDQTARALLGERYEAFIKLYQGPLNGVRWTWDEGISP